MMGTPLQDIYDRFFSKIDTDMTGQEARIFNYFLSAKSRCKKIVNHSLNYILSSEEDFEGNVVDVLDDEEIELIAMWMHYFHKSKRKSELDDQEVRLGTRDFNNFPSKVKEQAELRFTMSDLLDDIDKFSQQFNTYKYK